MESEVKIESAQEEIEILKKRIAELEAISGGKEKSEIIKEAIEEHAKKNPEQMLADTHKLPEAEIQKRAEEISNLAEEEKSHQKQIVQLLQLVQDKGILNTIAIVKKIDDEHLKDDFHDALIKYLQGSKNV